MDFVKFEKAGQAGVITIDRREALNALNSKVLDELGKIITVIEDTGDIRAAVLTGAGKKAFVSGADISEMQGYMREEAEFYAQKGKEIFERLENLQVPVIAAINGYALGGGCELALCCDIRLASETAVFSQPEASLGIIPGFGGTQRLVRAVGIEKAKEMIYTAGKINACEAKAIGLVSEVYAQEELMEKAMEMAVRIAQNAPFAIQGSKKAINRIQYQDLKNGLAEETILFGKCFETMDQKNAMHAFVKRDKPQGFRGQ